MAWLTGGSKSICIFLRSPSNDGDSAHQTRSTHCRKDYSNHGIGTTSERLMDVVTMPSTSSVAAVKSVLQHLRRTYVTLTLVSSTERGPQVFDLTDRGEGIPELPGA